MIFHGHFLLSDPIAREEEETIDGDGAGGPDHPPSGAKPASKVPRLRSSIMIPFFLIPLPERRATTKLRSGGLSIPK